MGRSENTAENTFDIKWHIMLKSIFTFSFLTHLDSQHPI